MSSQLIIGVFLALLIRPGARAQTTNASCFDEDFVAVNATGSVQIAGLQPKVNGKSETTGNWTISTAVKEILVPEHNSSHVLQRFWVDTDPPVDVPSAELTYTGCAFVLQGISSSKKLVGNNAGNSCQGVFDTACYNAIVDDISSNTSSYAAVGEPDICASLSSVLLNPPSECKNSEWGLVLSTRKSSQHLDTYGSPSCITKSALTLPYTELLLITDRAAFGNVNLTDFPSGPCLNDTINNFFNGSATEGAFLTAGSDYVPLGDQSQYKQFVDATWPVLFTVWPKDLNVTWAPDTRLACLKADHIETGSLAASGAVYPSHPRSAMALMFSVLVTIVLAWTLF